jgi:hypothetical protein
MVAGDQKIKKPRTVTVYAIANLTMVGQHCGLRNWRRRGHC